jgi:hypothetical protein
MQLRAVEINFCAFAPCISQGALLSSENEQTLLDVYLLTN